MSLRAAIWALAACAIFAACAAPEGDDSLDVVSTVDASDTADGSGAVGADAVTARPAVNACGTGGGLIGTPGAACGPCGDGVFVCADQGLRCVGATPLNPCGGCAALPADVGAGCGCGGVWTCDDLTASLVCEGGADLNACGGCGDVGDTRPGFTCNGGLGVLVCTSPNTVECREGDLNACGTTGPLTRDDTVDDDALPGDTCGACGLGVAVCLVADPGRIACVDVDVDPRNECGGCGGLLGAPEEACGCGGAWACSESGTVECVGAADPNACGGCEQLDRSPGTECDGGVARCVGGDATVCAGALSNACGGTGELLDAPGDPCGPLGDGRWICASGNALACLGASAPNSCGGSAALLGEPGTRCRPGAAWACTGPDAVRCERQRGQNRCGGVSVLAEAPGTTCGVCQSGVVMCISEEETICLGEDRSLLNGCGGCGPLEGSPGRPCGPCNTGRWVCDGANAVECVGAVDNAVFELFRDSDGDTYGDARYTRIDCPDTPGWVGRPFDCNDADASAHLGAPELCDDVDNDCDGGIDEDFVRYRDRDGDGFGDPATGEVHCAELEGWVTDNTDCFDGDPDAHPGSEVFASEPRPDGSFDMNCDGIVELEFPEAGRCAPYPFCNIDTGDIPRIIGFVSADLTPWWLEPGGVGPSPPGCGARGTLLRSCYPVDGSGTCTVNSIPRVQGCR